MSENPLYYSGLQTSKTSNLKPAISAALASLEVQLDQELSRYRRTRIAHRTPIQKSLGSLIAAKSPSSNVIAAASSQSQQNLTGKEAAAYIRQQQASISANEIKTTPPPPPPALETFPEVTSNKELNTEISSNQGQVPFPSATTNTQNQTESTLNQSSIVKADINRNTPPENISPPKDDTKSQPDDYLESSEALLRSLQEQQQPQTKKAKNHNDSLLSPLSIGSMLLLLVSSITFGYIIFNLDDLASFSLGGLFKRNEQITSSENTEIISDVNAEDKKLAPPVSRNPNLANDALPNINSIDDVAGATPKGKPTQAAKPSSPVTTTAPVEQSPPVANTPAPESPVSETEAVTTPQNLDEIEPSNGGFYNVIVDNTGNTLTEVKKVIPDAYLSPEGKYVYLGAFKSKTRLKNHLELLKEKGITARVEEPDS